MIFIGFFIGIFCSLLFGWFYMNEAEKRYTEGTERWNKSQEEFKKAVQILETERFERQEFRKKIKGIWGNLSLKMEEDYPELSCFVKSIEKEM